MKKELLTELINRLLSTGGTFGEIFVEDTKEKKYVLVDSILDTITVDWTNGVGFRLAYNNDIYYACTNDLSRDNLIKTIDDLKANINAEIKYNNINLKRLVNYKYNSKYSHNTLSSEDKKVLMKNLDREIRKRDPRVNQVQIKIYEKDSSVIIVNNTGLYVKDNRILTRMGIEVSFKDGDKTTNIFHAIGGATADEQLKIDFNEIIDDLIKNGLDKLYAKPCIGKSMPVVINNGFGAVIFHEACGHALEATSVADNLSILSNKLNTKIASSNVTLIDDGTLVDEWGSNHIDDEGNLTKKNTLIKDGILVNYLVDHLNGIKMNTPSNGCSRRESYRYAPTSRMSNTYLKPGNDSIEDMIKSIELGLYAKSLGGGSVSTETGDFNFAVNEGYMIRNGKIAECVKSASLIGNTTEILNNIEMISDNLKLSTGMCGSISGSIPVTIGQPTIKVSSILVGGEKNE